MSGITALNGRLPSAQLVRLSWTSSRYLRTDAARAAEALNLAHTLALGRGLVITSAYRTLEDQAELAGGPGLAMPAGRSIHGEGRALDISTAGLGYASSTYKWLAKNAAAYGWFQPAEYREGGRWPEPWHWEYDPNNNSEEIDVDAIKAALAALVPSIATAVWSAGFGRGERRRTAGELLAAGARADAKADAILEALAGLEGVDADAVAARVAELVARADLEDVAAGLVLTVREDVAP